MIKHIIYFLFFIIIGSLPLKAQFSESKERKKMWRKSARAKRHGKNREAFNPYLKKKGKDKPSSVAAKEDKKGIKKMRRDFKKQNRRNKKNLK